MGEAAARPRYNGSAVVAFDAIESDFMPVWRAVRERIAADGEFDAGVGRPGERVFTPG